MVPPPVLMFIALSCLHQSERLLCGAVGFVAMWWLFLNTECTVSVFLYCDYRLLVLTI